MTAASRRRKEIAHLKEQLGVQGDTVILYTGTLEAYQGIDLLESVRHVAKYRDKVKYVLVGGHPAQIQQMREMAELLGVTAQVVFADRVPSRRCRCICRWPIFSFRQRKDGKNTPLKIYSYLRSGKPIVATNILTHTQVLNDEVAVLTDNNAEAFGARDAGTHQRSGSATTIVCDAPES